jgi:hypothetical protein
VTSKTISYIAVGLREPVAGKLKKLILRLDQCVVENNKPPP